jgi:hypothetical protein
MAHRCSRDNPNFALPVSQAQGRGQTQGKKRKNLETKNCEASFSIENLRKTFLAFNPQNRENRAFPKYVQPLSRGENQELAKIAKVIVPKKNKPELSENRICRLAFNDLEYTGEVSGDLPQGYGRGNFKDGSVYQGEWRQGQRDGRGIMFYEDGSRYSGDWQNDLPHGKGTKTHSDGCVYQGEIVRGSAHGYGEVLFTNRAVYRGFWKDDVMNGKGTIRYNEVSYYDGHWKDGKKHGDGKFIYTFYEWYEGAWEDDAPHGQGGMHFENGDFYFGDWKNGQMHGHGVMAYGKGGIYSGDWEDGKPCGEDESIGVKSRPNEPRPSTEKEKEKETEFVDEEKHHVVLD